ncbi:group-specific protein [Alkalibacillus salilacus]|uniref:Phage pi2 protein 07 n=1 Tax=Alkalibacillus salilacus TaxID=284582 RepID=A0ABT9VDG5_9BACI|nr:group-specific protein [Alkalibacillus salilacus]MDQ0159006.1 phage pi2 protein 07 [Alkalibacillus salilacus]
MIEVNVDQDTVEKLTKDEIQKRLSEADFDLVLWDKHELTRRTCMSWSTIQKTFFYHPDCPKVKLGGKWYFKAEEMKDFLLKWVEEQKED